MNELPDDQLPDGTAEHYREFVAQQGVQFMKRYGAHGLRAGRKRSGGVKTDQLAVVFDVVSKEPVPTSGAAIPRFFRFTPSGSQTPVKLWTDVEELPMAMLE